MRMRRRTALQYAGTLGVVSAAGCLSSTSVDSEVFQLGGLQSKPLWDRPDSDRPGYVTVMTEDDEPWMVDDPGAVDGFDEWYAETNFEESVMLYIESVGLNTCYNKLDIEDISREGGRLTGTARAVDTSNDDEVCAEAITYPAAFVRVTGEELPTAAAITITTGWGDTDTVTTDDGLFDPSQLPGSIRPDDEPETVPSELVCEDAMFERHVKPVDDDEFRWGDADETGEPTVSLRLQNPQAGDDVTDPLIFERGDEIRFILTNVTERMFETGSREKYSLQVKTEAGWQDVRGWTDDSGVAYTDESISHPPGTAFEWNLTLTEDGVISGDGNADRLTVCPDLPAGRYRFVFWGLSGDQSVGVAFDYRD